MTERKFERLLGELESKIRSWEQHANEFYDTGRKTEKDLHAIEFFARGSTLRICVSELRLLINGAVSKDY